MRRPNTFSMASDPSWWKIDINHIGSDGTCCSALAMTCRMAVAVPQRKQPPKPHIWIALFTSSWHQSSNPTLGHLKMIPHAPPSRTSSDALWQLMLLDGLPDDQPIRQKNLTRKQGLAAWGKPRKFQKLIQYLLSVTICYYLPFSSMFISSFRGATPAPGSGQLLFQLFGHLFAIL